MIYKHTQHLNWILSMDSFLRGKQDFDSNPEQFASFSCTSRLQDGTFSVSRQDIKSGITIFVHPVVIHM